ASLSSTSLQLTIQHAPRMAQLTEALGRIWEAWAWHALLAQQGDDAAAAARDRLKKVLDQERPPQTLIAENPALNGDLTTLPLPDWSRGRKSPSLNEAAGTNLALANVETRFVDSAREAEIHFNYFNGADSHVKTMKLHQPMGGGVAVL